MRVVTALLIASLSGPAFTSSVLAAADSAGTAREASHEMGSDVPELAEFHEVIHIVWHEAWPSKDYARLRSLLPDIEIRAQAVVEARLPAILQDRTPAWRAAVKQLQTAVSVYGDAVRGRNDAKLLDAAETLHSRFEALARALRPPLPEMDAFHTALFPLIHHDLPAGDLVAIRGTVKGMGKPRSDLNRAALPARFDSLKTAFVAARRKLSTAMDRLVSAARGNALPPIQSAADSVHVSYLRLAAVFDPR